MKTWTQVKVTIGVEHLIEEIARDERIGEVKVEQAVVWVWSRHVGEESKEVRYGKTVELSVVADGAGWGGPVFEGIEVGKEFVIASLLFDGGDGVTDYCLDETKPYALVKVVADAIATFSR